MEVAFTWSDAKRESNRVRHRLDFADAVIVFAGVTFTFEDTRFYPVTIEEAPQLKIELSILSPPLPISAEEVEVGRHGLLISMVGQRGLLLPQVPAERNWDRITFLEQTCRKAGLPPGAWQRGAVIEAFTAEVFGEKQ